MKTTLSALRPTNVLLFSVLLLLGSSMASTSLSSTASPASSETDSFSAVERETAFVRKFYTRLLNDNDPDSLRLLCSSSLLDTLRAAYGFDGEGHAFWMFRSCCNGSLNNDHRVLDIQPLPSRQFDVHYMDGGIEGHTIVEIIIIGGEVKMNKIIRKDKSCE